MTAEAKRRLQKLGFEQDKGGQWVRGDDLATVTLSQPDAFPAGGGWVLAVDLRASEDGVPVTALCMRFKGEHVGLSLILNALEAGQ